MPDPGKGLPIMDELASKARALKKAAAKATPEIEFNHALIYVRDVRRSLAFYRDGLGFEVVEEMEGYARLRSPGGTGTFGLHVMPEDKPMNPAAEAVRLYFEAADVDAVCARLVKKGFALDAPPKDQEWGWRHAYMKDPDGHRSASTTRARSGSARAPRCRDRPPQRPTLI